MNYIFKEGYTSFPAGAFGRSGVSRADLAIYLVKNLGVSYEPQTDQQENAMPAEEKFVLILETESTVDITMLKSILDSEQVTYFIQGENMKFIEPFHQVAKLMVAEKDVQTVKELLKPLKLKYVRYTKPY